MKKILLVILAVTALLCVHNLYAADISPAPFNKLKELAISRGIQQNDGNYIYKIIQDGIEYWAIYSPEDETTACGQNKLNIRSGVGYRDKGFQFVILVSGKLFIKYVTQKEAAEFANRILKELESGQMT